MQECLLRRERAQPRALELGRGACVASGCESQQCSVSLDRRRAVGTQASY